MSSITLIFTLHRHSQLICTAACRSKWSTITEFHLNSKSGTQACFREGCVWLFVLQQCITDDGKWGILEGNVSTKCVMPLHCCMTTDHVDGSVKETCSITFCLVTPVPLWCNISGEHTDITHLLHFLYTATFFKKKCIDPLFTVLFTIFWRVHTGKVWNVTLICMLTMISSEIAPSWLMATLLPQKPPWAMWYDSPVIRH